MNRVIGKKLLEKQKRLKFFDYWNKTRNLLFFKFLENIISKKKLKICVFEFEEKTLNITQVKHFLNKKFKNIIIRNKSKEKHNLGKI